MTFIPHQFAYHNHLSISRLILQSLQGMLHLPFSHLLALPDPLILQQDPPTRSPRQLLSKIK